MKKIIIENFKYLISIIHWIFWWALNTILIILLILISLFIPKKWCDPLVKIFCTIMIYSIFIIPRKKGINIKELTYPVIFVANHVSFFDLFISGAVLPGYPRGFELKSHFYTPIYGWFISRFGQIPIEPTNTSSLRWSFLKALDILKNKERNLYVAPEGTRTINGKIEKFKSGAFYLSKKSNIPIVPVLYKKLYDRNNKNSFLLKYGFFDVIIFEPVYPDKFSSENKMAEYIRDLMIKNI